MGARLEVTGRQLDGTAKLGVRSLTGSYPWDFEAGGFSFPSPGCWEIEARAAGSYLRFVVAIPP
ncbi:MAG: hypothetical protein HY533_05165 [Chloroflexi bacterium]|nr:hypothetical protein [Chloroflexota bacterium]